VFILIDPYRTSKVGGGSRSKTAIEKLMRKKTLVTIGLRDESVDNETKCLLQSMSNSSWESTEELEIQIVSSARAAFDAFQLFELRSEDHEHHDEGAIEINTASVDKEHKHKKQLKGHHATEFSHLNGTGAETQKQSCIETFIEHDTMVTPEPTIGGLSTAKWPKIIPLLLICNPCIPSNPDGGPRCGSASDELRKKPLVVIVARDTQTFQDATDKIDSVIGSHFSSNDDVDVKIAYDADSFYKATRFERTKAVVADTVQQPDLQVRVCKGATPARPRRINLLG